MNCRRVVNLMSAYIDGELTGEEMLEIRRHLSGCADCEEEHQSTLFMKHALSGLSNVAPREKFAESILRSLDRVEVSPYQRAWNSLWRFAQRKLSPVAAALAASGVALVILSAGGVYQGPPDPQVVADAPYGMYAQNIKLIPEIPGGRRVEYTQPKPLEVADQTPGMTTASLQFTTFHR